MRKVLASAGLVGVTLMASAALAQSTGDQAAPKAEQQAQSQPAAQSPGSADFETKQAIDQWRAPKLIGVTVYGSDNQKIGAIKDVLIGHDGTARTIVIGVGGFLGMGTKDVALPFKDVQWKTDPRSIPSPEPPASSASTNPTTGTGEISKPQAMSVDPAAVEAYQGYPDKAMINMTVAQIKSAPDFRYAPDPLAEATAASQPGAKTPPKSSP
jgi:hypothetical protein